MTVLIDEGPATMTVLLHGGAMAVFVGAARAESPAAVGWQLTRDGVHYDTVSTAQLVARAPDAAERILACTAADLAAARRATADRADRLEARRLRAIVEVLAEETASALRLCRSMPLATDARPAGALAVR